MGDHAPPGAAYPGALDSVSRSPGRFDLVSVAPNGAIINLAFDETIPGSWAMAAVTGPGRAQANGVSITARNPGALDAFWIRPDGSVGTNWWHRERIRVHFKVINQPALDYAVIQTQLAHMVTAFAQVEIGVDLASVEHITLPPNYDTITVGPCNTAHPPSQEALDLFKHRNYVQTNEITLYVVHAIAETGISGCASHPPGIPSAVIESYVYENAAWTAAHETGHLLGLEHPCLSLDDLSCASRHGNRLMLQTRRHLDIPVPEITSQEKVTIYRSPLSN
jgi:hypothetical protein